MALRYLIIHFVGDREADELQCAEGDQLTTNA